MSVPGPPPCYRFKNGLAAQGCAFRRDRDAHDSVRDNSPERANNDRDGSRGSDLPYATSSAHPGPCCPGSGTTTGCFFSTHKYVGSDLYIGRLSDAAADCSLRSGHWRRSQRRWLLSDHRSRTAPSRLDSRQFGLFGLRMGGCDATRGLDGWMRGYREGEVGTTRQSVAIGSHGPTAVRLSRWVSQRDCGGSPICVRDHGEPSETLRRGPQRSTPASPKCLPGEVREHGRGQTTRPRGSEESRWARQSPW